MVVENKINDKRIIQSFLFSIPAFYQAVLYEMSNKTLKEKQK